MPNNEPNNLQIKRHSLEHVMTLALRNLYGDDILLGVGPTIENGFYQDFLADKKLSEENFIEIEKKMRQIINSGLEMVKEEISIDEAITYFESKNQKFKVELLNDIKTKGSSKMKNEAESLATSALTDEGKVTMYFFRPVGTDKKLHYDLCRGPHIMNTIELKDMSYKLDRIAGSYWRGDEKNPMLTRIYAIAFETQQELDKYYADLEEAKARDHRVLGKKLELFMFDETSPGAPYWLPNGLIIYNELVEFWRKEHRRYGYQEIASPLINKKSLYVTSGHWDHYKENMFISQMGETDEECYCLKPMNCPNAMLVFKSKMRSYKEFPLRLSDTDRLHRYELAGALSGLLRVRSFQQDDSHNFITEDLIESEYAHVFELCEKFYSLFGLTYRFRLGTRPESRVGAEVLWDKAEEKLKNVLEKSGKEYFILEGDGAFYGPKVDILMKDTLGREWQMGTIQLDFQLPIRFDLEYIDKDASRKSPIVIHRVIYGSIERFLGILIEHVAGAFPLWLSPVQVVVIPVSNEKHEEYGKSLVTKLLENNIRVEIYNENETLGNRIRKAKEMKVNYIVVVGDKEVESNTLNIRNRTDEQESLGIDEYVEKLTNEIKLKH